jgi:hypothetical protein
MALELLKANSAIWQGGFITNLSDVDWSSWQPNCDTLLVVDYARTRTKEFRHACSALYDRESQLKSRVRFLLLDRPNQPESSANKTAEEFHGAGTDRAAITSTAFKENIYLGSLGATEIWSIIKEAVPAKILQTVDRQSVLKALAQSDPQRRPLFALFAAHAISKGRDVRQWSVRALTQWVLNAERERFWIPAGAKDKDPDLNLLALATLVAGLSIQDLAAVADGTLLPRPERVSIAKYAAMSGRKVETSFPPLEPDILGELFVLDHFRRDDAVGQPVAQQLASLAWRLRPAEMAAFMWRVMSDFYILMLPEQGHTENDDEEVQEQIHRLQTLPVADPPKEWLIYATGTLSEFQRRNDRNGYASECEKIRVLFEADPQDPFASAIYAKALMGQICLATAAKDSDGAAAAFGRADRLINQAPDDVDGRTSYAKSTAAMLLLGGASTEFSPERAFDKINNLALRFPTDGMLHQWREICDLCVRIAHPGVDRSAHGCALCGRSALNENENRVDCILCMVSSWAQSDHQVREEVVRKIESSIAGIFGLILGFEREYAKGSWPRATFASALLSTVNSDDSNIRSEVSVLMDRLHELLEMYPNESRLLDVYAQLAPTVLRKFGADGLSLAEALLMIDRLESLAGRPSPKSDPKRDLSIWIGPAKFLIVSRFVGKYPLPEMLRYLDRAEQYFKLVPDEYKELTLFNYLLAVSDILRCYENAGSDITKSLLGRMTWLVGLYAKARKIPGPFFRSVYALTLAAMITRYRNKGALVEATALIADLDALVSSYRDEDELEDIRRHLDDGVVTEASPAALPPVPP